MKIILVINSGSTSIKFAAYHLIEGLALCCRGQVSGLPDNCKFVATDANGVSLGGLGKLLPAISDFSHALRSIVEWLENHFADDQVVLASHRLVLGGERFAEPIFLDASTIIYLKELCLMEPTHQPSNIAGIEVLSKAYPGIMQAASFDTAFHKTMPAVAQRYAISPMLEAAGLKHFGFHGISYEYISNELASKWPQVRRAVVMHLGGGASVCAMNDGKSVQTSMGFGAISGLPMATRSGDIPADGLLYLLRTQKISLEQLELELSTKSGLLGLSQVSGDMQTLELQRTINPCAQFAIDSFVDALVRYAGGYMAMLGGVDAFVFTGGIGEHSAMIRREFCSRMAFAGIELDLQANQQNKLCISAPRSKVSVLVIPANEEFMMAKHALALLDKRDALIC